MTISSTCQRRRRDRRSSRLALPLSLDDLREALMAERRRMRAKERYEFLLEVHEGLASFNMRTTGSAAVDEAVRTAVGPWRPGGDRR